MTTIETKRTDNARTEDLDVVIVGAGFAGVYLLDRLRGMGMSVQVLEAGAGPGGVWYWNSYPGARVDSPGPMYQFSREDLWRDWSFSELYPSRKEIQAYFQYVDEKLDLNRDIRFRPHFYVAKRFEQMVKVLKRRKKASFEKVKV